MVASAGVYAVPLVMTLGAGGLIQWIAARERAAQFLGLALPLGFLLGWAVAVGPGWRAFDAFGRIGHIVFGAALLGFALDFWRPRHVFTITLLAIFIAGSSWAEANNGLWPDGNLGVMVFARCAVSIVLAGVLAWRIDRLRVLEIPKGNPAANPTAAALIVLLMMAAALGAVAAAADEARLAATGAVLALAIAGYLPWAWHGERTLPLAALCPIGAGLFALIWAMVTTGPVLAPGIALAALILFADGTARRVPLPRARVSGLLYLLILGGIALLPLLLAVAVTMGLVHGAPAHGV